jgi:hypothetical protein
MAGNKREKAAGITYKIHVINERAVFALSFCIIIIEPVDITGGGNS